MRERERVQGPGSGERPPAVVPFERADYIFINLPTGAKQMDELRLQIHNSRPRSRKV